MRLKNFNHSWSLHPPPTPYLELITTPISRTAEPLQTTVFTLIFFDKQQTDWNEMTSSYYEKFDFQLFCLLLASYVKII